MQRFEAEIRNLNPEGDRQSTAFLMLMEQDASRTEARRERLTEAAGPLPGPVWFILVVGAIATIGIALLFADRRETFIVQASLIAAICALVTSGLVLVWFLDHPYGFRPGNIRPTEMTRLMPIVQQENPGVTPPCDSNGRPA